MNYFSNHNPQYTMQPNSPITREQFMQFFRNDEQLITLSPADRIEIFSTIMLGSSDFTKELLEGVLRDYCVEGIEIVER
jgi:hypothetical protein